MSNDTDTTFTWVPGEAELESSRIAKYRKWLGAERGLTFGTYRDLWSWSVDATGDFWQSIVDFFGVIGDHLTGPALTKSTMPGAVWFPDARLNYAENVLRHPIDAADIPAITSVDEQDHVRHITWRELESQVAALAHALRGLGVGKGDRVAAVLPNVPEAIVAFLATASIGAVWTISSPDLSATATLSRVKQLEPKILIGTTGYQFKGRYFDRKDHLLEIEAGLPTSICTVVVGLDSDLEVNEKTVRRHFESLISQGATPAYERLPFDHPLWVLFSSGTTGVPKGIVHGHGGMLLEALKTTGLNQGLGPNDLYYVAANTSWMVWNTLVHALASGAGILLYAGSPTSPRADRQFQIIADHRVTHFTTGAAYLTLVKAAGCVPGADFDFSALRSITSTAAPLPVATWVWVHESVKSNVHLGSDSGGTDICSAFIGSNPLEPVRLGQLQGPMLGVDVQAWDPAGKRLIGEVGEMVITTPLPAMPVTFWADPYSEKYSAAYFEQFPGVWAHGDWITETADGGYIVHGRSDATLNRDGVRLGSTDIYNALQHIPEIRESLVVGVDLSDGGYYQPLFIALADGAELTTELESRIVAVIRQHASARHVPDEIVVAPDIPVTHAGKKIEVPIKRLLRDRSKGSTVNTQSLANPESLDWFIRFADNFSR